jgi:NAD(P)-dependent dehydrogenase (short-subunit alcohol dehydrogenase family)
VTGRGGAELRGTVALVAGGETGNGFAAARAFARAGAAGVTPATIIVDGGLTALGPRT